MQHTPSVPPFLQGYILSGKVYLVVYHWYTKGKLGWHISPGHGYTRWHTCVCAWNIHKPLEWHYIIAAVMVQHIHNTCMHDHNDIYNRACKFSYAWDTCRSCCPMKLKSLVKCSMGLLLPIYIVYNWVKPMCVRLLITYHELRATGP